LVKNSLSSAWKTPSAMNFLFLLIWRTFLGNVLIYKVSEDARKQSV
jgi:hypothetical protein